ncbi:MAG: hypothetical protein WC833_11030 [Bacteroidales bacterium]|jgi:hypothetical protein
MRQKNLIQQIRNAVNTGIVKEQFNSKDFPFLSKSPSFLAKHAVGNGHDSEYFVRIALGLYKLKMEPFRKGDFIRLKDITKYHIDRFSGIDINVFEILKLKDDYIEVRGSKARLPVSEIEPILINEKDDLQIYYDPIIAASVIGPNERPPIRNTDYSYFYYHFKRCFYKDKNYQEHIKERNLQYVHEVQHFLHDRFHDYGLKINL